MPEELFEERTEEPTPRRREEARKRGQIVKSRELSSVAVLGTGFFGFMLLSFLFFQQFYLIFYHCINSYYTDLNLSFLIYLAHFLLKTLGKVLLPFFSILCFVVILVYLLQTGGGVLASQAIGLNFDRINPVSGFKRLFSLTAAFELLKVIVKLAIITGISYFIITKYLPYILKLFGVSPNYLAFSFKVFLKDFVSKLLVLLVFLGILDWLYARWDLDKKLRLTRKELKEEIKQTEGDPLVKAKIRQKQREMARRRMLAEVPKADVIITNPTHYAVALKYEISKDPAPQVVAKGKDFLAQKIKEIAKEHKVPIYEDPPLARLLYEKVDLGEYIPQDLYQVVAKVLAYVYKLKNKKVM
ncbi:MULTISPECIES: flagellar biosynthesis protein FlhB [Thermodesulfobacterium]|jgi:flagellar biosynthetic protein FlhB|uniref:Flagellar biosynthetic protein FlhB n=1 Tax=Thermodesulfobacterium commune DSM 2178 TaxID=289377 RepID=A0A075WRW8_9BACT|nr:MULTISPECIES: flagellar biosynthesis protein FlhB [Thermodesulfobacterium]AIH03775.1 hypothetical protein HL41_02610 [Thermodesulfobacterium commune DSM 2178]MBZ4681681.1 hypothetical protein [Thermodesulfobacterium sp.]HCE79605.1 flagellar biosynthesis protein FlhB [Thermodesulfobacterium commune]